MFSYSLLCGEPSADVCSHSILCIFFDSLTYCMMYYMLQCCVLLYSLTHWLTVWCIPYFNTVYDCSLTHWLTHSLYDVLNASMLCVIVLSDSLTRFMMYCIVRHCVFYSSLLTELYFVLLTSIYPTTNWRLYFEL